MNNPSLCAAIAALEFFEEDLSQMKILSISTGQNIHCLRESDKDAEWGAIQWIEHKRLLDIIFDGVCEVTHSYCTSIFKANYRRIDPVLHVSVPIDGFQKMEELRGVAHHVDLKSHLLWIHHVFKKSL